MLYGIIECSPVMIHLSNTRSIQNGLDALLNEYGSTRFLVELIWRSQHKNREDGLFKSIFDYCSIYDDSTYRELEELIYCCYYGMDKYLHPYISSSTDGPLTLDILVMDTLTNVLTIEAKKGWGWIPA